MPNSYSCVMVHSLQLERSPAGNVASHDPLRLIPPFTVDIFQGAQRQSSLSPTVPVDAVPGVAAFPAEVQLIAKDDLQYDKGGKRKCRQELQEKIFPKVK